MVFQKRTLKVYSNLNSQSLARLIHFERNLGAQLVPDDVCRCSTMHNNNGFHIFDPILSLFCNVKAWSKEDESGWESQLSLSFDHQLSCTLMNFELVQILMRVNESVGSFDQSWELHESRRELQKRVIFKSLPIRRRRKKENIITYHRQVTVGVMTQTVSSLTSVKKRRKRSGEATSKNKEIEKRRKTLINSHCSFDRVMRVEETLM